MMLVGNVKPILSATEPHILTARRSTDEVSALLLGLAEYMKAQKISWFDGQLLKFHNTVVSWSPFESIGKLPGAVIIADLPGEYEDSSLTPMIYELLDQDGRKTNYHLKVTSELALNLALIIWAETREQRSGLICMVNDALEPALFMNGLRLEIPNYFNARATYEKIEVALEESAEISGRYIASIRMQGTIPHIVPIGELPVGATKLQVTVSDYHVEE